MKITPVDIQHKQFRKTLQGYAREEVDTFLDEVIETLEIEIDERAKLEARVGELQEKVSHYKAMEESLQDNRERRGEDDVAIATNAGFAASADHPLISEKEQRGRLRLVETVAQYYWGNEI